ncbi:SDR family NAD(P)-dependent oxidoreductase [Paraburkholderia sp. RL17-337-BIB-A]|uniref:SDR family NAD(P)-dependent oxidoreductase n=1 Tax=Paraburkholderia sp. RL17-337-BIB-A TaxID=3031636 RepID=UPI0038B74813
MRRTWFVTGAGRAIGSQIVKAALAAGDCVIASAGNPEAIPSIPGVRGCQGGTLYSAIKFAIEGFSESLALEVAQFGAKVTPLEPGCFRTDFLDRRPLEFGMRNISDYDEHSWTIKSALQLKSY